MRLFLGLTFVFFLFNKLPVSQALNFIHEDGYCMWYGQCGINPSTNKVVNCLYNGPAKAIDNPSSLTILKTMCPEFAKTQSKVCCDYKQLHSLQSGMQSALQMMSRCPACWKNFRELYCQMMCSPNNSLFLNVTQLGRDKKSILSIDYYVEKSFRDGFYDSCKNVHFLNSDKKIMDFMCGTSADKCDPLKLLRFMGDPERNGVSPFKIAYPDSSTGKPFIKPMKSTVWLCNKPVVEPYANPSHACYCKDCWDSCHMPFLIKLEYIPAKIIFSLKPSSKFNQRSCYKTFPSSGNCELTGTILRLEILQKILKVQTYLMNMTVDTGSEKITFWDFCLKPPSSSTFQNCTVISVLQYWQNDAKKLNKCIYALGGGPCSKPVRYEFVMAAWGDHLKACVNYPSIDASPLKLSCKNTNGLTVFPEQVLAGYEGKKYDDSSIIYVTFAINRYPSNVEIEKASAWQKKFVEYLNDYEDEDLQVSYVPFDLPQETRN